MIVAIVEQLIEYFRKTKRMEEEINSSPYKDNLCSVDWLQSNHDKLMDALPHIWTHVENIDYVLFGLKLKLLDVEWETRTDLIDILDHLENIGMIIRQNGYQIRANVNNKFNES